MSRLAALATFLARRSRWGLLLLASLWLALLQPVQAQEEPEPTFGDSRLEFQRVFNAGQGIDQRWNQQPGNARSMSVPYLTDRVWLEVASFNYWRYIVVGGTLTNWTTYPSTNSGYNRYSQFSNEPAMLQVGDNVISVVSQFEGLPAETYPITVTRLPPSNVAELSGIGLSVGGDLMPAFSPAILDYILLVGSSVSSLRLTPSAPHYGTVTVDGHSPETPVSLQVGDNLIPLVVTAQDGVTTRTYTLTVKRAEPTGDLSLASLRIVGYQDTATELVPAYGSASITTSVPYGTQNFTIAATAADPQATLLVNGTAVAQGQASAPLPLSGASTTVPVLVTAGNGGSSQLYSLTVNRASASSDAQLAGLSVQGSMLGDMLPDFAPWTSDYRFGYVWGPGVGNDMPQVNVTATVNQRFATLSINGQPARSGQPTSVPLAVGNSTVTVQVLAEDGVSRRDYRLALDRPGDATDARLVALTPSTGTLVPAFATEVSTYSLRVPLTTTSFSLTPVASDSLAALGTIQVNGVTTTSGTASTPQTLSAENTTFTVDAVAGDRTTRKTYTVTVLRREVSANADLAGITLSAGTLSPAFNASGNAYRVAVPATTDRLRLTPQTVDAFASVQVNGTPLATGATAEVPLQAGTNTVTVSVTAEAGGAPRNYVLTVLRLGETDLSGLSLSRGVLQPAFSHDVTAYRALLGNGVSTLDLRAVSSGVLRVNGAPVSSGAAVPLALLEGDNTVLVEVSSSDGNQRQEYRLQLVRAPDPAATAPLLGFSRGPLTAGFYAWNVGAGDFDGDGRLDLLGTAVASGSTPLHSYLNTPTGMRAGGTYQHPNGGQMVFSAGDLNGDGKADMVMVTKQATGRADVLLGNGDGTFRSSLQFPLGTFPGPAQIADFNRDGKPDLVFQSLERLHFLAGNGDGSFAAASVIQLPSFGSYDLQEAVSGDLNRDGMADLLLLLSNDRVQVLLGRGDGTFEPQPVASGSCGNDGRHLLLHDFNNDGWLDTLNISYYGGISLRLGGGDGSFAAPDCLSGPTGVQQMFAGDYNADGVPDLLLALRESGVRRFVVLPGAGGTFGSLQSFPVVYGPGDNYPGEVTDAVSGDFDGDGRPDVVLAALSGGGTANGLFLALNRATPLRALGVSAGTLEPAFSASERDYRLVVGRARTTLEITPELVAGNHRVSINGQSVNSGSASASLPLQVGDNLVTITVTAASGTVDTYRLTVVRELPLTPPTAVTATAGDGAATVTFEPPVDDGGNPVLGYTVHASPADGVDAEADGLSRSRTLTGLHNGVSYTFTVTARNALGSSLPSAASAAVTPQAPVPVDPVNPVNPVTPANPPDGGSVEVGAGGNTVVDGSAPVVIGSGAVGGSLTVAGAQPVNLTLDGFALQLHASRGSVLKVVAVSVNGRTVPALALTQGSVQLLASRAGQVLLSLNGGAVLAGTADTRVLLGNGLLTVGQGRVLLSANAFAAAPVSHIGVGEQAVLDADGRILRVRLGSADGAGAAVGDALSPAAVPGLTLAARIPRLAGGIDRLPEGVAPVVREVQGLPATAAVTQDEDGVLRLASGVQLLPLGEVLIDETVVDGVTPTVDGLAQLARNGVVLTLAPAVADLPALLGDLRRLAADAAVTVTARGLLRVRLAGVDYVLRPDWTRQAAVAAGSTPAGGGFVSAGGGGSDGMTAALAYVDARGGRQLLHPGFVDPAQVCQRVLAALPAAGCQTESDGRIGVLQEGALFWLQASMQVRKADAGAEPHAGRGWWLGESGSLYFLFADDVQTATVQ